ncbi:MAG TPA: Ion transport protein, partial [Thiomicrospira sp.]|nr:Ion transport protein [Thiomicrospira sp.]
YLKNNWLNVLIVVIAFPWISVTSEWAPVLRILRLALFLRVFTDIFWDVIKVLRRNNFGLILVIASIFIALSGAIFSVIEDTNLATGLWYALVTVTTVGYGDVTANISAFLIGSRQRRVENEILKYVQTAQENLEKQARRNEEQL